MNCRLKDYMFYLISNGVTVRDLKLVVSRAKISQEMKVILVDVSYHCFHNKSKFSYSQGKYSLYLYLPGASYKRVCLIGRYIL